MSGKGSARRPHQISEAELALNWELAFGGYRVDDDLPCVVSGFGPFTSVPCGDCGRPLLREAGTTEAWCMGRGDAACMRRAAD